MAWLQSGAARAQNRAVRPLTNGLTFLGFSFLIHKMGLVSTANSYLLGFSEPMTCGECLLKHSKSCRHVCSCHLPIRVSVSLPRLRTPGEQVRPLMSAAPAPSVEADAQEELNNCYIGR